MPEIIYFKICKHTTADGESYCKKLALEKYPQDKILQKDEYSKCMNTILSNCISKNNYKYEK